jgi:ribosomal protein S18 acetylase RimI-like enzyme
MEGIARVSVGGGVHAVRGARLMASGLPTPKWNNADIESVDVDLEAVEAWYAARDVPWGVRVPEEWDVPIGQRLFTKRCFGLERRDAVPRSNRGGVTVRHAHSSDLRAYAATDAAAFGDDPPLTMQWLAPVLGRDGFRHWLAEIDSEPVGVAYTVRSDDRAGPAAMLSGLGVLAIHRGRGIEEALTHAAVQAAFEDGATLVHAYASDDAEARFLRANGFLEVPGLTVRVVRSA